MATLLPMCGLLCSGKTTLAKRLEHVRGELERDVEAVRDVVAAGHKLGNHSYPHERMLPVTPPSEFAADADAAAVTRHVPERTRPGSVILLHVMYPSRAETLEAAPHIIEGLEREGFRFVTAPELVAAGR